MRNRERILAVLLCACVLFGLAACGGASGGYRTLETFGTETYAIGFRNDDIVRYYIEAAIKTVSAENAIHSLCMQWFGEDVAEFPADAGALDALGILPTRTVIVGMEPDSFPVSYMDDNGDFTGFDVDVVRAVCARLGWTLKIIPIKAADAYIELSSGNVDVAWGALALDQKAKNYTVIYPYLTNELVIVSRGDSKFSSKRRLSDATLAIDTAQKYMDALKTDESLMNRLGQIKRVSGGAPALFAALSEGQADAILVSSLAVTYYGRY